MDFEQFRARVEAGEELLHGARQYGNGCRCEICAKGNAQRHREYIDKLRSGDTDRPIEHGTAIGYAQFGCRCEPCRLWHQQYRRNIRAQKLGIPLEDMPIKPLLPPHGKRTHCIRGHELTADNIYSSSGKRACRPCTTIRSREARERKRNGTTRNAQG